MSTLSWLSQTDLDAKLARMGLEPDEAPDSSADDTGREDPPFDPRTTQPTRAQVAARYTPTPEPRRSPEPASSVARPRRKATRPLSSAAIQSTTAQRAKNQSGSGRADSVSNGNSIPPGPDNWDPWKTGAIEAVNDSSPLPKIPLVRRERSHENAGEQAAEGAVTGDFRAVPTRSIADATKPAEVDSDQPAADSGPAGQPSTPSANTDRVAESAASRLDEILRRALQLSSCRQLFVVDSEGLLLAGRGTPPWTVATAIADRILNPLRRLLRDPIQRHAVFDLQRGTVFEVIWLDVGSARFAAGLVGAAPMERGLRRWFERALGRTLAKLRADG